MDKVYIDTAIWIDYYEDRKDSSKDIGDIAFNFILGLLSSGTIVVVSDFLLMELEHRLTLDEIRGIFRPFEGFLLRVQLSDKQDEEATKVSRERNVPKGDVIHAIIARDNGAKMISRDKHFFQFLNDICEAFKPEDFF